MAIRLVSGIVGVALFLAFCFAGTVPFAVAVSIIALTAATEFALAQDAVPPPDAPNAIAPLAALYKPVNGPLAIIGALTAPAAYFLHGNVRDFAIALLATAVLFGIALVLHAWKTGAPLLGWFRCCYGKVGFWYMATCASFVMLRTMPGKLRVAPFAAADRGAPAPRFASPCAYGQPIHSASFSGRAIGKRKLAPKLSPGKTIEGFAGGLPGAVAVGLAFGHWIGLAWPTGASLGAIAGIIGPLGDLFESADEARGAGDQRLRRHHARPRREC